MMFETMPFELMRCLLLATTEHEVRKYHPTGSREICQHFADSSSDWDVICLVEDLPESSVPYDGQLHDQSFFRSVKYSFDEGVLNLLFTSDEGFYNKFVLSTKVAKELDLANRYDRVVLFQAILYGVSPIENKQGESVELAT